MDPGTKFLIFAVFSLASLAAGYLCRKRQWIDEEWSRPLHFHTSVWVWSAASVLSLWKMPLGREDIWLAVLQPLIVAIAGYGVIPLARWLRCDRRQTGVVAIASGLGNLGFTLGGYLAYSMISPGDAALVYAITYVSIMQIAGVVLMYPIARYCGELPQDQRSTLRLIALSFVDIRAMPLYGALVGMVLAWSGTPFPQAVSRWHLVDVIFYLGSFGGYFGIGLRLRLGHSISQYLRQHALLTGMKYLFIPAITFAMLALVDLTPWPMDPVARKVVIVEAFMPTAIWTVMLANMFHLDVRLASAAWLWNTIAFMLIPLPVILWFLR